MLLSIPAYTNALSLFYCVFYQCVSAFYSDLCTECASAVSPQKKAEAYTISGGLLSTFFWVTMTYAVCWTVKKILKNIKGIFSAGILARSDAILTGKAKEISLSISFRKQKEFEPAVLAANIDRGSSHSVR